jgi:hypothetical protein
METANPFRAVIGPHGVATAARREGIKSCAMAAVPSAVIGEASAMEASESAKAATSKMSSAEISPAKVPSAATKPVTTATEARFGDQAVRGVFSCRRYSRTAERHRLRWLHCKHHQAGQNDSGCKQFSHVIPSLGAGMALRGLRSSTLLNKRRRHARHFWKAMKNDVNAG